VTAALGGAPGATHEPGRVLALDFGTRRIGIAVSDPLRVLARPVATIERTTLRRDLERIAALAAELEATIVVVGLPLLPSGDRGASAVRAEAFAARLAPVIAMPIVFWDESYTTESASERRRTRREGGGHASGAPGIDAEAAAVILEEWMAASTEDSGGRYAIE
jgi:putative Holliday junction resolvase